MTPEEMLTWLGLTSLSATLLAGGVLLARERVHRAFGAGAVVALWAAPALRLFLPPLGLGLIALPWGGAAAPAASAPAVYEAPSQGSVLAEPTVVASTPIAPALAEPAAGMALPFAALALGVWLAGACLTLSLSLLRTDAWRRLLVRTGRSASPALRRAADAAAAETGYGGRFDLVLSDAAVSPQVIGLFRPLVALPADFEARFAPNEQRLALLHEVTHLKRRDLWIALAAEAACAVHWFNPLLARCLPALRADQEAACDEKVRSLGASTPDYAGTLLRAASGPNVPALTLNHDLKRRIETMKTPLPRPAARVLGTGAALALALGAAAATQEGASPSNETAAAGFGMSTANVLALALEAAISMQRSDDPNFDPSEADGPKRQGERAEWSWSDDERSVRVVRGEQTDMVLLSDPFGALMPERPEPPTRAAKPPRPPKPPVPDFVLDEPGRVIVVSGDGETRRVIELEEGERLATENGGEVILVPGFDEAAMADFETDMEAWSDEFEGEMDGFEEVMEAFGERMGEWGEKMGAVGEAVGELGDRCEDHRERTARPTVLKQRVEGSGETVKAVCARGGAERYASVELERFVEDQAGLSAAEKAAFLQNRDRGLTVHSD